jgi:hypothetical protein
MPKRAPRSAAPAVLTLALLVSILTAHVTLAPPVSAQGNRLVLAFYYAWFSPESFGPGKTSDQPITPYRSTDRAVIQRQVGQAQQAGIDAFVQSWYGPRDAPDNQTESNFRTLLDVAKASGFRAAVDVEVGSPFFASAADVQNALAALLAGHAKHPAYLKVDGRPVVFFWYNSRFSVAEWTAIRAAVDPNHNSIWIGEGTDAEYLRVFDGHHLYSITWTADPQSMLVTWGQRVRAKATELGGQRYWVGTTMPGWNDLALGRGNSYVRPRDGGSYFRSSFAGAAKSGADWAIITSFNEWPEGSMIEPSVSYGDAYLKLARELADAFRAGTLAPPAPAAVVAQPVATATPTILPSPTRTFTPAPAPTASPTATSTSTPQPTATPTPAAIPTATPSATPMETPTEAPTPLSSPTATLSVTPTATLPAGALLGVVDQSMATMGVAALALASFLGGFWRRRQSLRQPRRKQRQ